MAVQEARVSPSRTPPRSRAPSQEIFKELKTGVKVLEVSERSSLLEDFGSLEDSTSEDSAGVNLPVKTPVPGGPQFFARSLEADTRAGKAKEFVPKQMFKVQQPISGVAKPVEDEDPGPLAKEQVFTRFLKDHPAEPKLKADTGWLQMGSDTPDLEDFKRPPPNLQMLDGRTVNQYVITESPADIKEYFKGSFLTNLSLTAFMKWSKKRKKYQNEWPSEWRRVWYLTVSDEIFALVRTANFNSEWDEDAEQRFVVPGVERGAVCDRIEDKELMNEWW
jgi:hypothetical protein